MSPTPLDELKETFDEYIQTPTQQKQETLMVAASAYREYWIEAKATDTSPKATASAADGATTRYKRIFSVEGAQPDGTEITLALQSRTSRRDEESHTWYVVSWRTRLKPGGHNRRFYVTNDEPWRMPASTALEMLVELEGQGGLKERYFDRDRRPDFVVRVPGKMTEVQRVALLQEITLSAESWGENPFFVVLNDPNDNWRKIMLMNPQNGEITFRSTTTDEKYMPRKTLRPGSEWYLDNSMQDSNVQQARVFLKELRSAQLNS